MIFSVPQTREMFLRRMRTVLDTYVKPPGTVTTNSPIEQKVVAWRDQIAVEAALDRAWWGWPAKGGQCNFDPGIDLTNGVNGLLTDFLDNRRKHFYGKHSSRTRRSPSALTRPTMPAFRSPSRPMFRFPSPPGITTRFPAIRTRSM